MRLFQKGIPCLFSLIENDSRHDFPCPLHLRDRPRLRFDFSPGSCNHFFCFLRTDHTDPVPVSHNDVSRIYDHASTADRHFNRKCRSYDLLLCDVRLDLVIHCMIKSAFHPVTKLRYGIISEFFHKLFYLLLHSSSAPFLIDLFLSYNKAILLV